MPLLTFTCPVCSATFQRPKVIHDRRVARHGSEYQPKCSPACLGRFQTRSQEVECKQCGRAFPKLAAQVRKTSQHFCSRSCAASYNNRHKQHGTRRSTLEQFVEEQLRTHFPRLPFECNGKAVIGSEVDFYFPTLRLAIELNGIFHYEPIHGLNKFKQICNSDKQKAKRCHDLGIRLHVVDASNYSHPTPQQLNHHWSLVKLLLTDLTHEADDAVGLGRSIP